jgi:DNA repair protein RadC
MYIDFTSGDIMDQSKPTYRITDMAESERPRERLARLGPQALNTAELLAILLRVGVKGENAVQVGQRILNAYGGLRGLHQASFDDVKSQRGLGEAKAATIKAAIELGRRLSLAAPEERTVIHSPTDVAALVQYEMSALEQEHLRVMLLDTRNQVLDIIEIYHGSLNSSMIRVGEVFKPAVRRNAASIIVIHNHPSGDPTPSPDDTVVTNAIVEAGKLMDIEVLDHVIIGQNQFVSLKERGLGFD